MKEFNSVFLMFVTSHLNGDLTLAIFKDTGGIRAVTKENGDYTIPS